MPCGTALQAGLRHEKGLLLGVSVAEIRTATIRKAPSFGMHGQVVGRYLSEARVVIA